MSESTLNFELEGWKTIELRGHFSFKIPENWNVSEVSNNYWVEDCGMQFCSNVGIGEVENTIHDEVLREDIIDNLMSSTVVFSISGDTISETRRVIEYSFVPKLAEVELYGMAVFFEHHDQVYSIMCTSLLTNEEQIKGVVDTIFQSIRQ